MYNNFFSKNSVGEKYFKLQTEFIKLTSVFKECNLKITCSVNLIKNAYENYMSLEYMLI
jgi:hypothetical protein